MRPLHESDLIRKYAVINSKGRNSHNPTQKKGSTLAKKAEKYANKLQVLMPVSGKKLRKVEDSDEENDKKEKFNSILPKSKQYIENFLKSRRMKSSTEVPQIVVNAD
ncbi:hypothetical protein SteCoe_26064 [Stentor coeruleus]|uniref:Uncharacterized protein n=1 Tax=Stentor coeruleus TaxID=5963 RepID=A0A1R2BDT2_9CILI|nr:hypothetical protein SteCoe_26064 [Stentor coeruleus]